METNLVVEGIKFMGLGMGAVFLFLGIMILVMSIMSSLINKYFPEVKPNAHAAAVKTNGDNKKIIAAVTAAIKHHREG
jgi:oxaloacetate decarboxylase gamma subunit